MLVREGLHSCGVDGWRRVDEVLLYGESGGGRG